MSKCATAVVVAEVVAALFLAKNLRILLSSFGCSSGVPFLRKKKKKCKKQKRDARKAKQSKDNARIFDHILATYNY